MPLPASVRRRVPERVRHSPALRALAVGSGLIPPRTLHHPDEAELFARLAASARRAVEIGVYEGASAAVLARALPAGAELHLIDPFGAQPTALRPGQRGTAWASRRVVARAARDGVTPVWHVAYSQDVGPRWTLPIDLLFIDGDHSEEGVRRDWDLFSPHVSPGGHVMFHDARADAGGAGWPGPTAVVKALFGPDPEAPGWELAAEVGRTVAVRRLGE
jgi:predicted O-methyltransferase YrrM